MTSTKHFSFWSRLGQAVRRKRNPDDSVDELPQVGDDGLLSQPVDLPEVGETDLPEEKGPGPIARWSKRDQTLTKLQEGYERVTRIIEETEKHLAEQGQRSERICNALDQLAQSMGDLPGVARRQAETLEAIAAQMDSANTRSRQMASAIEELPKIARVQGDTLAGINQQLQMAGEQNLVTTQTMDKLGTAVSVVGEATQTQTRTLREMDTKAGEHNALLAELIDRQSKRFTLLFVVTLVLAGLAAGLGVLALLID